MMYNSKRIQSLLIALLVISFGYSQSKTRTKKEVFTVNKDVTLDISTSHADVEFDTWNKNKVEITATIEVEDATQEEVDAYFERWNFKAIGNSEKVTVTSKGSHSLFGNSGEFVLADQIIMQNQMPIVVEIDEIAEIPEVTEIIEVPELPLIVMESMEDIKFDYEAFKKDGDAYMKKWKEQWKSGFDEKKFKEGMEEWKEKFEAQQEEREKVLEKFYEKHALKKEELAKIHEEALKTAKKYQVEVLKNKEKILEKLEKVKALQLNGKVDLINGSDDNIFFLSKDGKHLKVKKKIKIKMPKKAKLKLNVRHGEVTIASVGENMNAKLSHAALYANVIEGANTTIETSYAPVHVTKWNEGALKVNFVENVDLQSVTNINLMSNSSKVSVGTLGEKGIISGTFGNLLIHNIGENFQTLDIILENTDARIQLPSSAFKLYYIGSKSSISYPETVKGTKNKTQFNTIVRGYQKTANSGSEININAKYSDVVLNKKS
ncbi:hypothetical protein KORDIASMS9_03639 [Kordia sp. SMS9]|uniref:hypothetical protein n=1 Tax=Kordia sp. SMS9 TaxID=2282170 RepID=UPI000E0CCFC4|nr:hypothetical protein [Kordia sp. SMS9]AXG71382.1 hypothetical protein KORDIASMS9_03639 [Kordia sp. SMS9]